MNKKIADLRISNFCVLQAENPHKNLVAKKFHVEKVSYI